jgi:hypothetical protein
MLNSQINTAAVEVLDFNALVNLLDGNKAARFVSLTYRAKGTGELARHTINLNVNRNNALRRDVAVLTSKLPTLTGIEALAAQELIDSMNKSLNGTQDQYTKAGYYAAQGNGNVQVSVKAVAYVRGYSIRKTVLEAGTYKAVKSVEKTIAKNKLRKLLKNTRCREFLITPENFLVARHNGKSIEIDASGTGNLADIPPINLAAPVNA